MTFYYTTYKFYSQKIMNMVRGTSLIRESGKASLNKIPLGRILNEERKNISGRGKSKYKDPKEGINLEDLRNRY